MVILLFPILCVFVLALCCVGQGDNTRGAPLDEATLRAMMEERWAWERRVARRKSIAVQVFAAAMFIFGIVGLFHFGLGSPSGTAEQRLSQFIGDVPGLIASGTLVMLAGTLYGHVAYPSC